MLPKAVIALCLIAMSTTTWAAFKETGEFPYSGNQLGRMELIKAEFGDDPLPTITALLADPETDAVRYRRAAAATAFFGADGLKLLLDQLKPMLAAQQYSPKTEACLRTVKYIQDPQSIEISLVVLESASAPASFKAMAADNLTPLINRSRAGSGWRVYRKPDGSSVAVMTSPRVYNSREPAYSSGKRVDRACLLRTKERIGDVLTALADVEENRGISKTLEAVMQTIDKKFDEAKNDSSLPDPKERAEAQLKSLGEQVGEPKTLSDGRVVSLYLHRETKMQAGVASDAHEPAVEYTSDKYQFTITGADGKSTEVVFSYSLQYPAAMLSRSSSGPRWLDVRVEGDAVVLFYNVSGTDFRASVVRSPNGVWFTSDSGAVPHPKTSDTNNRERN